MQEKKQVNSPLKTLPKAFLEQMQQQIGEQESRKLAAVMEQDSSVSIRLNPQKVAPLLFDLAAAVPWCESAYYLAQRPNFAHDPLWHAGAYYVQEASSMLIDHIIRHHSDCSSPLSVLDLCASPGGKTTLLASAIHPHSTLIANEAIKNRVGALYQNIARWGRQNVFITQQQVGDFAAMRGCFDVVLADAPCSGEGLFRKQASAMEEWSPQTVAFCAARQRSILQAAAPLVKKGGILIYSTCTYNQRENEENAVALLDLGFESLRLSLAVNWGVEEVKFRQSYHYHCYPHRVAGEGFYCSVFRKTKGENGATNKGNKNVISKNIMLNSKEKEMLTPWIEDTFLYMMNWLKLPNGQIFAVTPLHDENLKICTANMPRSEYILLGEFKGKDFIPSHELALNTMINNQLQSIELNISDAQSYLKKENFELKNVSQNFGWTLAKFNGLPLGWLKLMPNRYNNYYPTNWRILK
ncbi:MAG: RNA methyltransferase [Sphingobacteriales bacterium]|nr:RNA methyltransferase [Sphingobacteriales bacterium]